MKELFRSPTTLGPVQVRAELEPVRNVLTTLWALTANQPSQDDSADRSSEEIPISPWLAQRATSLPAAQRAFNRVLFAGFGAALLTEEDYADFEAYLRALAQQPVADFYRRCEQVAQAALGTADDSEVRALLADFPALRQKILDHLRTMWDEVLASEWQRHQLTLVGMTRTLNETVFEQPLWQAQNAFDSVRFLLQIEPTDEQLAQLAGVRQIVLVLSPHLLGYCHRFGSPDTLWLFRPFDPVLMRRDPLRRAEVLSPLTALADDSRLRILELLTEQGELRAQEIITQVESSQGNVSRHLKQLVNGGFVSERRAGDANKHYAINERGLRHLQFLLRQLLSNHNVTSVAKQQAHESQLAQVRATVPPQLQDFVDVQGRITRWSSKAKEQDAMLAYLIDKFEPERKYSEKQVNETLRQWYLDPDFVLMRRGLIEAGLLQRTKDGAQYWRS